MKPEVSSLDFTQALTLTRLRDSRALATNRVESEMDLADGQTFAIAGLLDNRVTEQMQKIPGIGDIPILGKLFQSRSFNKSKNELLIVVTPRIVHPIPADKAGAESAISRSSLSARPCTTSPYGGEAELTNAPT